MFELTKYFDQKLIFGMEIRGKVANFVADKTIAKRINSDFTECNNIGLARTNAMKSLHNFIRPNTIENIFICFADPHFKSRNKRRRIITESLLTDYAYVMKPGALLYCVTDVEDLHKWQVEKLKKHPMFEQVPVHKNLSYCERMIRYHTDEAQKVKSKKGKVWHAVFKKVKLTDYNDAVKCVDKITSLFGTTKENLASDTFAAK
jgi:tRNA (guanine-N7-)-methyltransferase